MNATLKKIASMLNLSISTVSRALKNHPDISTQTKTKVREIADFLDYEPNSNAISLRTKNNRVFGLLIPSAAYTFYDSFMTAIEVACIESEYSLLIMQSNDNPSIEQKILKMYKQNRVSGIFACLSAASKDIEPFLKLKELGIPLIFFDKTPLQLQSDAVVQVVSNDIMAATIAAKTMVEHKKKNILAIMGNKDFSITKNRLQGLQNIFEQEKNCKTTVVYASTVEETGFLAIDHLSKKKRPDVVFCMSDEILIGVMKVVQQLGIEYPKDLGIICVSDGFFPKIYYPEISYVETSGYKMGELAYQAMQNLVQKKSTQSVYVLNPELVDLGSL